MTGSVKVIIHTRIKVATGAHIVAFNRWGGGWVLRTTTYDWFSDFWESRYSFTENRVFYKISLDDPDYSYFDVAADYTTFVE